MTTRADVARLLPSLRQVLGDASPALSDEFYYAHLPLCVLDAVFAAGERYPTVQRLIARYCTYYRLQPFRQRDAPLPDASQQQAISQFISEAHRVGAPAFAEWVIRNRRPTASRNGILRAEAAIQFAEVLRSHGVESLQDAAAVPRNTELEDELRAISGNATGGRTDYFFMIAGSGDRITPTRRIIRFVERGLGREVIPEEAEYLLAEARQVLRAEYPTLSLRELDHEIWKATTGDMWIRGGEPIRG